MVSYTPITKVLNPVSAKRLAICCIRFCAAFCTDCIFCSELPDTYNVSFKPCAALEIPVACSLIICKCCSKGIVPVEIVSGGKAATAP